MNDNVGDMPLEIFGDYVSDVLNQEWSWEYLVLITNGGCNGDYAKRYGYGIGYGYGNFAYGCDNVLYHYLSDYGNGHTNERGDGFSEGMFWENEYLLDLHEMNF
jgi:hypothetical protein